MSIQSAPRGPIARLALWSGVLAVATLCGAGCQAPGGAAGDTASTAPRGTQSGPNQADTDRAALARFVGVWNFEGSSIGKDGARKQATGRAAAAIENEYFVLFDLQATGGNLSGQTSRKAGSMIFASEPGIGLTLTAWGDASPSICRLVGRVREGGNVLAFEEAKTPGDRRRISLVITFENKDRWTAEVHDLTAPQHPLIASYTFRAWTGGQG
jgi:hypothetical protein